MRLNKRASASLKGAVSVLVFPAPVAGAAESRRSPSDDGGKSSFMRPISQAGANRAQPLIHGMVQATPAGAVNLDRGMLPLP